MAVNKKDIFRIKEEMELPSNLPNAFQIKIRLNFHVALRSRITDIRYHVFPASVTLYHTAERNRIFK